MVVQQSWQKMGYVLGIFKISLYKNMQAIQSKAQPSYDTESTRPQKTSL